MVVAVELRDSREGDVRAHEEVADVVGRVVGGGLGAKGGGGAGEGGEGAADIAQLFGQLGLFDAGVDGVGVGSACAALEERACALAQALGFGQAAGGSQLD